MNFDEVYALLMRLQAETVVKNLDLPPEHPICRWLDETATSSRAVLANPGETP